MAFGKEMVIRGSQERVAPVLMTALTNGLGLIPLALAAGEPGKELLYPVAVVVIGGLLTSTVLDFFVRPAAFLKFSENASRRTLERMKSGSDSLADRMDVASSDAPTALSATNKPKTAQEKPLTDGDSSSSPKAAPPAQEHSDGPDGKLTDKQPPTEPKTPPRKEAE